MRSLRRPQRFATLAILAAAAATAFAGHGDGIFLLALVSVVLALVRSEVA